ncbi:glycosyltransferase [Loktanella sp. Alg231-35]|uniref:glycosyltransferase n=1 Tax=Loktanella sp. Alg231-35 TaxID=1922220 RepID=UPI000D55A27D|nr:hypothetical protein [Loktanella sp. Alg231-35]
MVQPNRQKLTLVIDPRFSGGTSAAVAREIYALAPFCDLNVVAISSKLFKGRHVHERIAEACEDTATPLVWDPAFVSADLIALHNPSFLKFDDALNTRLVCDRLFVVCHENLLRPDGPEGFDVRHCLGLIADQALARAKYLSPVSGWNRKTVTQWLSENGGPWQIAPCDWTNICDFQMKAPCNAPQDRRGRHSRPGLEKFPPLCDLEQMFPPSSQSVRMLGADNLIGEAVPQHWDLLPFGAEDVDDFLQPIDFFIYYTHPFWQESFGRVIAEALAAGKVVIAAAPTATTFADGVIAAAPEEVDGIVAALIATPQDYHTQVARGQAALSAFGVTAFQDRFAELLTLTEKKTTSNTRMETLYDLL